MSNHTFVVCAYKESEYLKECIESLLAQTVKSRIVIATSTPNEHIRSIAGRYGLVRPDSTDVLCGVILCNRIVPVVNGGIVCHGPGCR